jgi:hypothetical protein
MMRPMPAPVEFVQRPTIHAAHEQPEYAPMSITNVAIAGGEDEHRDDIALLQLIWQVVWSDVFDPGCHSWAWSDGHAAHGGIAPEF